MPDSNWEYTNYMEIQTYTGVLIYMDLITVPDVSHYFQGYTIVCPISR
jgi:hypothetical protein